MALSIFFLKDQCGKYGEILESVYVLVGVQVGKITI